MKVWVVLLLFCLGPLVSSENTQPLIVQPGTNFTAVFVWVTNSTGGYVGEQNYGPLTSTNFYNPYFNNVSAAYTLPIYYDALYNYSYNFYNGSWQSGSQNVTSFSGRGVVTRGNWTVGGNLMQSNSSGSSLTGAYSVSLGADNNVGSLDSSITGGKRNLIINSGASFIGGGRFNTINGSSTHSVIGGGFNNTVSDIYSSVLGGYRNTVNVNSPYSAILGGINNKVTGIASTILGGAGNSAGGFGTQGVIVAGDGNHAYLTDSVISGGGGNIIDINGYGGVIAGGYNNEVQGSKGVVSGGIQNNAAGEMSVIGGGNGNLASGKYSSISSGYFAMASGLLSTITGGNFNTNFGSASTIGNGNFQSIGSAFNCGILSGGNNYIDDGNAYCVIAGGSSNAFYTTTEGSTISGGESNIITDNFATISGGQYNTIVASHSVIGGGFGNTITGKYGFIGGGKNNTVGGRYSSILDGIYLNASAENTTVIGIKVTDAMPNSLFVGYDNQNMIVNKTGVWASQYMANDSTIGFSGTCTILGLTSINVKNGLIVGCT